MSVIAEYLVSVANPSTLNNVGQAVASKPATGGYFSSPPPTSLWNTGATGVNSPITSAQLGQVPTATSALGQLQISTIANGEGKLLGNRFRIYATGSATTSTGTPTFTPYVMINTGTVAASGETYTVIGGGTASSAMGTAPISLGWSVALDLTIDPATLLLYGFMKYQFQQATNPSTQVEETIPAVPPALVLTNGNGSAGFGFVCGCSFSTGSTGNTASLYEFKIVQD
jgi:hypothetical protein